MSDWSQAYARYRPVVMAFLTHRMEDRDEAEDLCQETFMRVLQAPQAPHGGRRLRPYLLRTALNLLRNRSRRRGRIWTESDLHPHIDLAAVVDSQRPGPAADVAARELTTKLRAVLNHLPPEHRIAFERGVLQRQPYAVIAAETGWSLAKVKVNVFRARQHLITELRAYLPPREGEN